MKKELYFDRHSGLQLSALAEDGKLIELGIESEERKEIVGNIYKGRVVNVIASMNAAFIDCGLEKNCFLPLSGGESFADSAYYQAKTDQKRTGKPNSLQLKAGDELIVQVTKTPRGNKGAKVTVKCAFVGKHLIFLPGADLLAISRKINEAELRNNLLFMADGMRGKRDGLIVRTIAPYATPTQLQEEIAYLKNLHLSVMEKNKTAKVGDLLHREYDLPVRVMRDSFNDDIERVVVGERALYEQMLSLAKLRPAFRSWNIQLYTGEEDMFSHYGIAEQVKSLSESTVALSNGGHLVIEHTEALTAIDVNTGKFLGDENLEDTVYATNIAAAREIARQVRLRDVGGIVVVDFIDMQDERHKKAVTKELEQCLSRDKVKCRVLPMNELCLVEFARKRTTNGVASQLLQPCPHCNVNGYILSNEFNVCLIRAALLNKLSQGAQTVVIEMNRGVMEFLISRKMLASELSRWQDKKVYLVPHRTYHQECFTVAAYKAGERVDLPEDAQLLNYE
ncbi:MAG: Rne/Rng family ribonuclease [Clostridia bacterium]|nr:Rne/Rng family ribonuclease [Clostridia bacterium]